MLNTCLCESVRHCPADLCLLTIRPPVLRMAPPAGENERVSLGKNPVKARGPVESWLGQVESNMVSSLRRLAKAGVTSYPTEPRQEWVLQQPAQLVIAVSQVYWCNAVEEVLQGEVPQQGLESFYQVGVTAAGGVDQSNCDFEMNHPAQLEPTVRLQSAGQLHTATVQVDAMHRLLLTREALLPVLLPQVNVKQLSDLTKLVRGSLSNLSRRVLAALITIDVHARDIIGVLVAKRVSSTNDFDWQMQLRYYWEEEDLVVRQVRLCGGWTWVGEIMSVHLPAGACRDLPECTQKTLASPGNGRLAQDCGAMQALLVALETSTHANHDVGSHACWHVPTGQRPVPVCLRVPGGPAAPGGHTHDRPLLPHPHRRTAPEAGWSARWACRWVGPHAGAFAPAISYTM